MSGKRAFRILRIVALALALVLFFKNFATVIQYGSKFAQYLFGDPIKMDLIKMKEENTPSVDGGNEKMETEKAPPPAYAPPVEALAIPDTSKIDERENVNAVENLEEKPRENQGKEADPVEVERIIYDAF